MMLPLVGNMALLAITVALFIVTVSLKKQR
jgi:hypothetical protein